MIHTAICDDYPAQAKIIEALLEKYLKERPGIDMRLYSFLSGAELLKGIGAGNVFNLLLLDILMPEMNGIELARGIREHNEDAVMVFLTSSTDHALEAYGVSAAQYIVKPIKERDLFPVLDRVIPMLARKKERYFLLSAPESDAKIPFSSIICVELNHRRLRIYLENGNILNSKYIRKPFAETVAPLLQDHRFVCPHKSFVLNIEKAEELKKDSFVMKNGISVPISRFKYAETKEIYMTYIAGTQGMSKV
jgi:DNA-binding LytR/AlgR family response regulator